MESSRALPTYPKYFLPNFPWSVYFSAVSPSTASFTATVPVKGRGTLKPLENLGRKKTRFCHWKIPHKKTRFGVLSVIKVSFSLTNATIIPMIKRNAARDKKKHLILFLFSPYSSPHLTPIIFFFKLYIIHTHMIPFIRAIMNKTKRSIGQGNLRSRLDLRPAGLSVVQRLATRSVT